MHLAQAKTCVEGVGMPCIGCVLSVCWLCVGHTSSHMSELSVLQGPLALHVLHTWTPTPPVLPLQPFAIISATPYDFYNLLFLQRMHGK